MLVRPCVEQFITDLDAQNTEEWRERHQGEPHLFVSDIGGCPRQAFYNAVQHLPDHPWHAEVTHPFDPYLLELFRAGKVWEQETRQALEHVYGDRLQCEVEVGDAIWAGRIDFLIATTDTDRLSSFTIVEHKATNPVNFQYKGRLPYQHHCMQLLLYDDLLCRFNTRCVLYYRGWSNWAEFEVYNCGDEIAYEGLVNGKERAGQFPVSLSTWVSLLERSWEAQELPPKYETPFSEPFGCTRTKGERAWPACRYFGACWPDYPQEGPFNIYQET